MCPGKRKVIQDVGFKSKPVFVKQKCIKKTKFVSINVLTKKLQIESEKERVTDDHQTPFQQTPSKKLVDPFIDNPQVKKTLSNWRQLKIQSHQDQRDEDRHDLREKARLKLEKIQNTAGFNDNIDSMNDFYKLIGCSMGSISPYPCTKLFHLHHTGRNNK